VTSGTGLTTMPECRCRNADSGLSAENSDYLKGTASGGFSYLFVQVHDFHVHDVHVHNDHVLQVAIIGEYLYISFEENRDTAPL
jgi:hypothetical protein